MTLRENMTRREKVIWTIAIFALMALEVYAISADRRAQNKELSADRETQVKRFEQTMKRFDDVISHFAELQRTTIASYRASAQVQMTKGLPETSLKRRATTLSAQILKFVTDRQAGQPPLPRPETWDQDTRAMTSYFNQTVALYSEAFGAKVIAIHDEFARLGLRDSELDQFYEHPTNPIGMGSLENVLVL